MMKHITYRSKDIQIKFDKVSGRLNEIIYKEYVLDMDSHVWKLSVKKGRNINEVTINDSMDFYYESNDTSLNLYWGSDDYRVKVTLSEEDCKVKWCIDVESLKKENGIYKVIFPIFGRIKVISPGGVNDYLVLPWQNGFLIKNPLKTFLDKADDIPFWAGRGGYKYENEYPAQYSFQFSAYYSPDKFGYYFSTEDGDAHIKTMGFYYNKESGGFDFAITNYLENMGEANIYIILYQLMCSHHLN